MTQDELLKEIREELAKLRAERAAPPVPVLALSYEDFGKAMGGVSASTIKRAVAAGDLIPVRLMGRKLIPVSELERLRVTQTGLTKSGSDAEVTQPQSARRAAPSGKREADAIRASNRGVKKRR